MQITTISKIRKIIYEDTATISVNALVVSKLEYCNLLLYILPVYLIHNLQMVLKSVARLVTLTPKANRITSILRKLHCLPVSARIDYKIFIMVYKCLNGTGPKYLRVMLQVYSPHAPLDLNKTIS